MGQTHFGLDCGGLAVLGRRHYYRGKVGLRHIGMGRLLELGSCGERIARPVAGRRGADAYPDSPARARQDGEDEHTPGHCIISVDCVCNLSHAQRGAFGLLSPLLCQPGPDGISGGRMPAVCGFVPLHVGMALEQHDLDTQLQRAIRFGCVPRLRLFHHSAIVRGVSGDCVARDQCAAVHAACGESVLCWTGVLQHDQRTAGLPAHVDARGLPTARPWGIAIARARTCDADSGYHRCPAYSRSGVDGGLGCMVCPLPVRRVSGICGKSRRAGQARARSRRVAPRGRFRRPPGCSACHRGSDRHVRLQSYRDAQPAGWGGT